MTNEQPKGSKNIVVVAALYVCVFAIPISSSSSQLSFRILCNFKEFRFARFVSFVVKRHLIKRNYDE